MTQMGKKKLIFAFVERVLRLLITQGWYREPSQGYFANNRLSNLIKKDQAGYHLATYMLVYVSRSLLILSCRSSDS
jgi:hypothetical protein